MTVTAEQQQRAAGGGEGRQAKTRAAAERCGGRRGLESRVNLARRLDGSCGQEISEFCWAHAKFTAVVRHHVGRVSGCRGHAAGEVFLLLLVRLLVSVVLIVTRARRLVWLRAEITSTADSRRKDTLLLTVLSRFTRCRRWLVYGHERI